MIFADDILICSEGRVGGKLREMDVTTQLGQGREVATKGIVQVVIRWNTRVYCKVRQNRHTAGNVI